MQARSSAGVLEKVFLDHPHALGESYWQHQGCALRFGAALVGAGVACLIHALVPAVFVRTASRTVQRLYEEMRAKGRLTAPASTASSPPARGPLPAYAPALLLRAYPRRHPARELSASAGGYSDMPSRSFPHVARGLHSNRLM